MGINIMETFDRREREKSMEEMVKKWIFEATSKEFKVIKKLLEQLVMLLERKQY